MRRRAFSLWKAALLLAGVGLVAVVLYPIFGRARDVGSGHRSCQSNLKQIGLGFAQYIQDYDEKYQPVSLNRAGWVQIIQPYLKSYYIFQCPSRDAVNDYKSKQPVTDYFYNARLAGVNEAAMFSPSETVMNGDGLDDAGANAHLTELPFEWLSTPKSPALIHLEGANYSFADGHVKWCHANNISTASPNTKNNLTTFAID